MFIAGASSSLIRLLERQYHQLHEDSAEEHAYEFRVFNASQFTQDIPNHVTLFLYRVDVDPTRRHVEVPPESGSLTSRVALGLDLRYLLTVWAQTAEREQQTLGECMEILDEHAVISGDQLDDAYAWPEDTTLKISLDSLSHEDMLRLWDSLEPAYHLSIPYVVRTIRMRPKAQQPARLVESRTNVWTPAVPR